ncbi:MAG: 30S ribosomal protein S5 [Candidatus Omnitrophica bacterium]|nr:30S ribosomal protein S5 [Candidatus Omnitrophota bacterium]
METERQVHTAEQPAFIERVISINRVTKVTKGGKNLAFSALVVVGDGRDKVGYAMGKANEVASAIKKAIKKARRELIEVKKVEDRTIPHETEGMYGSVRVMLKPASKGTGVIAGATVRAICECAGINDILTKILRKSRNPINVVKATFNGLDQLKEKKDEPVSDSHSS